MAKQGSLDAAADQVEADAERMDSAAVAKHDADKREIAEGRSKDFKQAARDLGCDEDEDRCEETPRKPVTPKT